MKKKSKYKKKRSLNGITTAKTTANNAKASALQTGKDVLIGVIGGGIAGAIIGKTSLLIGAGVTGYGHYAKHPMLTTFGIGMMASGGLTPSTSTHGIEGVDGFSMEEIKTRVLNFKDSLAAKLFLDTLQKPTTTTHSIGAVNYYSYPTTEIDVSALDQLHQQITQSGIAYQQSNQAVLSPLIPPDTPPTNNYTHGIEETDFDTPSY